VKVTEKRGANLTQPAKEEKKKCCWVIL
jgi:hypothetical protein